MNIDGKMNNTGYNNPFFPRRNMMGGIWQRIKDFFGSWSVLSTLMLINIAVYLLQMAVFLTLRVTYVLNGNLIDFNGWILKTLACPADFGALLQHPWTLVTSLFLHSGFWHLFFNMFMLYVVGKLFRQFLTARQLLFTYLAGGLVGNMVYMLAYQLFPRLSVLVPWATCMGASGAVMAVMFAVTLYRPNHPIQLFLFGQTTMKWIAVVFIVIDLFGMAGGSNVGGHFAHLGGAAFGALMALVFRFPMDAHFRKPKKKKAKFYTSPQGRPLSDEEFNAKKHQDEQKVDVILDKISKNGYDALNKEEKDFLYFYKR